MSGSLLVRGGRVLTDGRWVDRDLVIADGVIVGGDPGDRGHGAGLPEVDADGLLVAPGLVDLQCNGAAGIDLRTTPERLWEAAAALPEHGVTAWLPTIVTSRPDVVERARSALAAGPAPGWSGAEPIGLHLEGPFLSPDAAGAHTVDLLRAPSLSAVESWSRETGVAMVTLAPELDGALEVIAALASRGVVVSIGHSQASATAVDEAVAAGASCVTHLFNAMSPLHHREPGVVGAAMSDERLIVGLIADGVHVDPSVVRIATRALGDRLVVVSDAVAPLGTAGADWRRGVRLRDGTLAGSVLPLIQAVRNLVDWTDRPLDRILAAATSTPATLLGDAGRGSLRPGGRGDAVVLTRDLDVVHTVVAGDIVHTTRPT